MSKADQRKKRDWKRHLEGWRAGVLVVWLGALATSLAVPRPTQPFLLPVPPLDARQAEAAVALEAQRAAEARTEPLPHAARLIGELFRRLGKATVDDPARAHQLKRELVGKVKGHLAKERQGTALLRLRALQGDLFLEAVRHWESTGKVSDELRELGGDFIERARAWRDTDPAAPDAASGPLVLSDQELRLLFRVRWGMLTGTHRVHPFGPSLNEFRQYYGTILDHPPGDTPHAQANHRLAAVDALARIDSSYPASFARGVLLSQLGNYPAAAAEFERYSEAQGDGPWMLLARNHWLAAQAHLQ